MNDTHLTSLYVSASPASKGRTLTSGQVEIDGTLYADGAFSASGATTITGATTCLSTLTVSGAATLSSTLAVTSTSSLSGDVTLGATLLGGSEVCGSYSFQATGASTGVTVSGMLASDLVVAFPKGGSITQYDVLATSATAGGFTVTRMTTGSCTSALPFGYIIVRPSS